MQVKKHKIALNLFTGVFGVDDQDFAIGHSKLKPLLTEIAECFLKDFFNIFMTYFYRTFKLKINLNLNLYYNSRFKKKIIKSF